MPIISKETWEKFTQKEKDKVREWNNHLTRNQSNHKSYSHDCDEHYNNGFADGRLEMLDDLFGEKALQSHSLTYEDVARELFLDKDYWIYSSANNNIQRDVSPINRPINSTSREQIEKLLAINKLLNVAKFLNKDWKPDENDGKLWTIGIEKYNKAIMPVEVGAYDFRTEIVYFPTQQLTNEAIQILGEDTVRLALTTNW